MDLIRKSILLVVVLLVAIQGSTLAATAQGGDEISISLPNEVTAGEATEIGGQVSVKDRPGSWETPVTVTLKVDGRAVASKEVTVKDGETTRVSFTYTFESEGTIDVTLKGEASFGSYTYEDAATGTITVSAAESGKETATVSTPTDLTPSTSAQEFDAAFFPVPKGLQDDVDAYREQTGALGPRAFIVATESAAYIAFADERVAKGSGTVSGRVVSQGVASLGGVEFGAMIVTSVSPDRAEAVSLEELAGNSDKYALDEVRVRATHSVAAVRQQPETGAGVESPSTLGVLTGGATQPRNLTRGASTAVLDPGTSPLPETKPRVFTTSTATAFWADDAATVDGVVLPEGTAARRVAGAIDVAGMLQRADGDVVVSVTATEHTAEGVGSVGDLLVGEYVGETVRVEANVVQSRVSTQELLTQTTPCGESKVPVKEACVPVPSDVVVHSGVAWDAGATETDEVLVLIGASSRAQEKIVTSDSGRYRITGQVVSLQEVDGRLPDRRAIVVSDMERLGSRDQAVPTAVSSLKGDLNRSVVDSVSENASASAAAVENDQASSTTETSDQTSTPGSEKVTPSPTGAPSGIQDGPIPVAGPGFGAETATTAVVLFAIVALAQRRLP